MQKLTSNACSCFLLILCAAYIVGCTAVNPATTSAPEKINANPQLPPLLFRTKSKDSYAEKVLESILKQRRLQGQISRYMPEKAYIRLQIRANGELLTCEAYGQYPERVPQNKMPSDPVPLRTTAAKVQAQAFCDAAKEASHYFTRPPLNTTTDVHITIMPSPAICPPSLQYALRHCNILHVSTRRAYFKAKSLTHMAHSL